MAKKQSPKVEVGTHFDYELVARNGVAESPFEEYPGTVTYAPFSLATYKKWRDLMAEVGQEKADLVFYSKVDTPESDEDAAGEGTKQTNKIEWVRANDAKIALGIASKINIENLPDGWQDDAYNLLPYNVLVWLALTVTEWASRHITFRRDRA